MQVKTSQDIGALIRDQRNKHALTQQQLAAQVGVSRLWIVQLEKGKPTAQLGLALRALKALGVSLDAVVSPTDKSDRKNESAVNLDRIIHGSMPPKL